MANLLCHADGKVWISDDRISAQVSQRSAGVEQIDFHGIQPVSRNAKLLQHDAGVLRFFIDVTLADKRQTLASTWENIRIGPATIAQSWTLGSVHFELQVTVAHDALLAHCCCSAPTDAAGDLNPQFRIIWNAASQTTSVHGQRTWAAVQRMDDSLVLRANDRILLREWLRRAGDYQGDFLIPEGWRRLIFSRRCVSGTARFEDVRPEYRDSDLLLYDADTWIRMGGPGYDPLCLHDSQYEFRAAFAAAGKSLRTPTFSLRFFTQEPAESTATFECRNLFVTQEQRYQRRQQEVPTLELAGYPGVCDFFQHVPLIVESARVQDYGMTRACPGTYYWLWAWDNLVTTCAQIRWGDVHEAGRVVDFVRTHRDLDGSIPGRWSRHLQPMDSRGFGAMDFLFSELVLSLYGATQDRQIIRANYPTIYNSFRELLNKSQESVFFPTIGMYPDLPRKMGRDESYYVAIDSGAWYALCRNMAHMAWMMQDEATARTAEEAADRVEANFLKTFWDQETGFVCDSVNPLTGEKNRTFPLFSLLCTESPFGHLLLAEHMEEIGRFLSKHMLQPHGLAMTPTWDRNHHSEPAMSAWYPHWDLAAVKVWSRCRDGRAIQRWLDLVELTYRQLGYCPEFLSLHAPDAERWLHHGAAWNLNCATGWYSAILHALFGLQFDPGGISLLPVPGLDDTAGHRRRARVGKLYFCGGQWDFITEGEGDHIIDLRVDGEPLHGACKIPHRYYTPGSHSVHIRYGERAVPDPVLAEWCGGQLLSVQTVAGKTSAMVRGFGRVDFRVCAGQRPHITLDGQSVSFSWQAGSGNAQGRVHLAGDHELVISESRI